MSAAGSTRAARPAKPRRSRSVSRSQFEAAAERQGAHVASVQRARLLAGAVRAVDRYGYAHSTVSEITALAHVSRRTFYELFSGSEECLLRMFEEILDRARSQVAAAELDGLAWRERMRGGLWAILCFLDAEPVLARAGVVQSARGGPRVIELRERLLAELAAVIDEGRAAAGRGADSPELIAEGLVGAVASILHTRLVRGESAPLRNLQGELMAMIVAPYLGPAAARARAPAARARGSCRPPREWGQQRQHRKRRDRRRRARPAARRLDALHLPHRVRAGSGRGHAGHVQPRRGQRRGHPRPGPALQAAGAASGPRPAEDHGPVSEGRGERVAVDARGRAGRAGRGHGRRGRRMRPPARRQSRSRRKAFRSNGRSALMRMTGGRSHEAPKPTLQRNERNRCSQR